MDGSEPTAGPRFRETRDLWGVGRIDLLGVGSVPYFDDIGKIPLGELLDCPASFSDDLRAELVNCAANLRIARGTERCHSVRVLARLSKRVGLTVDGHRES